MLFLRDALARALERIESDKKIANVLISFRYSAYLFGDQLQTYPDPPRREIRIGNRSAADSRELVWSGFETIIRRVQQSGKRVFVLLPVPDLGWDVSMHLRSHAKGNIHYARGTSVEYARARNEFINKKIETLKWSETLIKIDPVASLCDPQYCYAIIGDEAMYFDHNHLSLAGSRRVLSVLKPYIESAPPDGK